MQISLLLFLYEINLGFYMFESLMSSSLSYRVETEYICQTGQHQIVLSLTLTGSVQVKSKKDGTLRDSMTDLGMLALFMVIMGSTTLVKCMYSSRRQK